MKKLTAVLSTILYLLLLVPAAIISLFFYSFANDGQFRLYVNVFGSGMIADTWKMLYGITPLCLPVWFLERSLGRHKYISPLTVSLSLIALYSLMRLTGMVVTHDEYILKDFIRGN